jgi:hypothetical protein
MVQGSAGPSLHMRDSCADVGKAYSLVIENVGRGCGGNGLLRRGRALSIFADPRKVATKLVGNMSACLDGALGRHSEVSAPYYMWRVFHAHSIYIQGI